MVWKHGAHSTYDLQYHLIFTTKYRRPVLRGVIAQSVRSLFHSVAQFHKIEVKSFEMGSDHVHALVAAPPSLAPADLVRRMKSFIARETFHRHPYLRNVYWGGEFWGDGYCIRSVGEHVDAETVQRYIEQHAHESREGEL